MKIKKFPVGILGTNCYLVTNEETKETVIIDPGGSSKRLFHYMEEEELKIVAICLTHGHFDHIMGIDSILEKYPVTVYVHEDDGDVLKDARVNQSAIYTKGYTFSGAVYIKDCQVLNLAGYDFEVIHTPGHTRGSCSYYVKDEGVLFSGDTLFQNSVGRTDFENSSTSDLLRSIRERLFVLPNETHVYPGHSGETLIGHEKMHNPYVSAVSEL